MGAEKAQIKGKGATELVLFQAWDLAERLLQHALEVRFIPSLQQGLQGLLEKGTVLLGEHGHPLRHGLQPLSAGLLDEGVLGLLQERLQALTGRLIAPQPFYGLDGAAGEQRAGNACLAQDLQEEIHDLGDGLVGHSGSPGRGPFASIITE
ncbi:hypothetical protein SAMN02746019_00017810 [Thermoflexus hugenholtzii JAD2]|uniref:Uncharacterized protein n=1 Tax=Thermoflexus hugenholtzii JAD2 TaxID=877466 RepID=A0A212RP20_9CHLR|nr:hypothetical protein SAMN02746019_00017810 [Thermoflexus hugenholtzii JAD2]